MRGLLVLMGALVVLGAMAAPAQAGTATVRERCEGSYCLPDVRFDALPGEVNDVSMSSTACTGDGCSPNGYMMVVQDTIAPVTPGSGCRARDAHTAECPYPRTCIAGEIEAEVNCNLVYSRISLGDRDDTGTRAAEIFGEAGNDTLRNGGGEVDGGAGSDLLVIQDVTYQFLSGSNGGAFRGGDGDDTITGAISRGQHVFADGGPGADLITQGTADYRTRTTGVLVTLDGVANDGAPGEGDNIGLYVHGVRGGAAADVITAGPFHSMIYGYGGDDVITGSDQSDAIYPGDGSDRVTALGGGDFVMSKDGVADLIDCGAGSTDELYTADTLDTHIGCETANLYAPDPPPTVTSYGPTGTSVNPSAKMTVTFSEEMQRSSAEQAWSLVHANGSSVAGTFSWNGTTMTFTPKARLSRKTNYTARVSTAARDLGGNALQQETSWTFKTS